MKKIFKYNLEIQEEQTLFLPKNSIIISLGLQNGSARIWAMVEDTESELIPHVFYIFGTGHPIPDNIIQCPFLGTLIDDANGLVWHVYLDFGI